MSIHTPNSTTKLPQLHMIRVPGGTFEMGSEGASAYGDEKPVHRVTVSDFELSAYAVTQALWELVMEEGSKPSSFEGPRRPVERVSWFDALAFCNRLNAREKLPFCYFSDEKCTRPYALEGELPNAGPVFYQPTVGAFRLPTEAEWEYAAQGGSFHTKAEYPGSDQIKDVAWYNDNSGAETQPVGLLQPNALGMYDLSGNVREWCWDWYGTYAQTVQSNPSGPAEGNSRMARGGAWDNYNVRNLRVTLRYSSLPDYRLIYIGFRLARHLTL